MTQITNIINTASEWLLKQQDQESGGWADLPGGHVNALNTAETMIALIDGGICIAGADSIRNAVQFLLKHQTDEGQDRGSWPREVVTEQGNTVCIPDLVRTSFAIQALIKAGVGINQEPVQEALKWLLTIRDEDTKGWGYARGKLSKLMPTCFALTALLETYGACPGTSQMQIRESLKHMVDTYYNDGGDEVRGSFGDFGPLQGVHTIYAALVLQVARNNNLSVYLKQEKQAIEWLLRHPDTAIRLKEEWVAIVDYSNATGCQAGGYGFMFMTDTLLIRLLMGSDNVSDRETLLARDAMNSLKDKVDENTGAFYGSRLFSWSTAKALSALSVLRQHAGAEYPDFPQRPPEYKGWKIGSVILGFGVLLSGFGFYLMVTEKFSLLAFSFFAIMMLVALLAYDKIGEKTFKELFGGLISPLKGK